MSRRFVFSAALMCVALVGGVPSKPERGKGNEKTAAPQGPQTTTLDDQTELAVTVYNSNIALVRDVRALALAQGTADLHFMDIAATVNPATVHFRSLTEPARVSVLEQNYEYDLLEPEKLLRKYVDGFGNTDPHLNIASEYISQLWTRVEAPKREYVLNCRLASDMAPVEVIRHLIADRMLLIHVLPDDTTEVPTQPS